MSEDPPLFIYMQCLFFCVFFVVSGLASLFVSTEAAVLSIVSFALLVPALSIELFCSLSILRILRRPGPGDNAVQGKKEGNQQKMRAVKIICIVLVMLIWNVVPVIAVPFFYGLSPLKDLLTIAFTFATAGSSVQAFLFLRRSGKVLCKAKS